MSNGAHELIALARWRELPPADRRALLPAAWRLLAVRVLLAILGTAQTQRTLARWASAGMLPMRSPDIWQCRARALQRVGARMPATRCLARSLTLWWWMRARGLAPVLRMGVRPGQSAIGGHAWIECDGHLFDETAEGAATYSLLDWKAPD